MCTLCMKRMNVFIVLAHRQQCVRVRMWRARLTVIYHIYRASRDGQLIFTLCMVWMNACVCLCWWYSFTLTRASRDGQLVFIYLHYVCMIVWICEYEYVCWLHLSIVSNECGCCGRGGGGRCERTEGGTLAPLERGTSPLQGPALRRGHRRRHRPRPRPRPRHRHRPRPRRRIPTNNTTHLFITHL